MNQRQKETNHDKLEKTYKSTPVFTENDFSELLLLLLLILLLIIISIFKEDNVFSIIASLPYDPPMNTEIDFYQTLFFGLLFFVSVAMLVVQYLLGEEKPVLAL